jgi:hypothetical protein
MYATRARLNDCLTNDLKPQSKYIKAKWLPGLLCIHSHSISESSIYSPFSLDFFNGNIDSVLGVAKGMLKDVRHKS